MRHWKAWGLAAASGLLGVYAVALLFEGFIAPPSHALLTYPFIDEPAAKRAYDDLPPRATAADRGAAAERLAEADPADPQSWTAVAYADWRKNQRLSPKGIEALDHSYAVSFFDRTGAIWRVSFALENWGDLTPQIRHDVLTEAKVALADPTLGPKMRARLKSIGSPEGRLAAFFLLSASPP